VKKKAATRRDVTITDEQGQLAGPLLSRHQSEAVFFREF
jgi:hypothetical protein